MSNSWQTNNNGINNGNKSINWKCKYHSKNLRKYLINNLLIINNNLRSPNDPVTNR